MRYAIWNNKGGVGKTFLSFILSTGFANLHPEQKVIVIDMCPQANLSEIVLGGNGAGSNKLEQELQKGRNRKTIGGYLDKRIESPHQLLGFESDYLIEAKAYNSHLPSNLYLIAGDPSLEVQAQVINQISSQILPEASWMNVHNWLKDLILSCVRKIGSQEKTTVFIDCNPSFSAYTELAMVASERLLVPCSSDGSSARAIDNIGALLFGIGHSAVPSSATFSKKMENFSAALPVIHAVLLNRSTQYDQRASKAFRAMFDAIKIHTLNLKNAASAHFSSEFNFLEMPDSHSVAIVCSHLGKPLYQIEPGPYPVHDTHPQVNSDPLNRYKEAVQGLLTIL